MICARMVENGYWTEIADTQGCQTMMWQKALCSKGFRALGCRRIIYLYIFIIYEIIYIEKKYAGCHSADTHAHPTVEDATADTIKKESLFFRKKNHRKQFRKSRSENRIRFLFGFRFGFALATIGGISLRGKKKTRHGGRGFYYRCHQRRGVFCFSHHRTRSAMSAGCVSGIVIRSQPLGVR